MRPFPPASILVTAVLAAVAPATVLPLPARAAQEAAKPTGPVRVARFEVPSPVPAPSLRLQEREEASVVRVSAWSLLGAVVGTAAGAALGAALLEGDFIEHGGVRGAIAGAPFGAALGAGLGAHFGSRGRGSALLTIGAPLAMVGLAALIVEGEAAPVVAGSLTVPLAVVLATVGPGS